MIQVIRIIQQNLQSELLLNLQRKKKEKEEIKEKKRQAKQAHNLLLSVVVFVCNSYIFFNSFIVLDYILIGMSTMSTSDFEYE